MAFYDELLSVFDKYNVGLPPHLAQQLYQLHLPPPQPFPQPVPLDNAWRTTLATENPDYAGTTHVFAAFANSLTGVNHQKAEANVWLANGRWLTDKLIGVCLETQASTDLITGQPTQVLKDPQVIIPNSYAWPPVKDAAGNDLATEAGVIAHINALPPKGQGGDDFPHH